MLSRNEVIPLYQPQADKEEERLVMAAIRSGYWNEGSLVRQFERQFAEFVGARFCLLVPNGRIALYMACKTYEVTVGYIPAYYGIFAAQAAQEAGNRWSLADVEKNGSMDKVGLVVHANGRIGDTFILEDCCQAITYHRKEAISCYSFHSTKMMTCGGIGGAVCCDKKEVYEKLCVIKDHGRLVKGDSHPSWGSNFKMSDLNAAFGIAQLEKLPAKLEKFNRIYQVYRELLGDKVGWLEGAPQWRVDCMVDNPEKVIAELAKHGIEAKRFYLPCYRQPQFKDDPAKFPNCEYLYQHGIYLPSSPSLTDEQLQFVCERVKACL